MKKSQEVVDADESQTTSRDVKTNNLDEQHT